MPQGCKRLPRAPAIEKNAAVLVGNPHALADQMRGHAMERQKVPIFSGVQMAANEMVGRCTASAIALASR
jgi:vacuolar-type H+-ATPase subunit B/Vma2